MGLTHTEWSRKWPPTPVFLPGKFHGQRSLVGYNPWGRKESDATEHTRACTHTESYSLFIWPTEINVPFAFVLFLKFYFLTHLFLAVSGLHCHTWALPSWGAWVSHCGGFSGCGAQALGSLGFSSCSMWAQSLAAPWHVEASQTRDQTCALCIGRWDS